jgi:hypothetical protein
VGVEFRRYLIPRPNSFRPCPDAALRLVGALRDEGWLLGAEDPALARLPFAQSRLYETAEEAGYFALAVGSLAAFTAPLPELFDQYADQDLMVVWPVESLGKSGLRYPLEPLAFLGLREADDCYYELQFRFGRDFIYDAWESIDPFDPPPSCPLGHPLEYEPSSSHDPFFSSRIAANCPSCGAPFDTTQRIAQGRDQFTGAPMQVPGGATYRFAIVVDCGKCFGRREHSFHPRLKALVEATLGTETYEISEIY